MEILKLLITPGQGYHRQVWLLASKDMPSMDLTQGGIRLGSLLPATWNMTEAVTIHQAGSQCEALGRFPCPIGS